VDESEGVVRVSREEATAIAALLGIGERWFRRRYLVAIDDGWRGIRLQKDGSCPFLGPDMLCKVYEARPLQCRLYPYWPELVMSGQGWHNEAKRCEGIGRGREVDREHVERCLAQDRRYRMLQLRELKRGR
jgi:Fe-S-cluster containining protein